MAATSLGDILRENPDVVGRLRNSQIGMYVYPVVTPEFTNWRTEQAAWRHSAVLFDQSHHMDELTVEGPDAEKFLSHHGFKSFANFDLNRAKPFVPVTASLSVALGKRSARAFRLIAPVSTAPRTSR